LFDQLRVYRRVISTSDGIRLRGVYINSPSRFNLSIYIRCWYIAGETQPRETLHFSGFNDIYYSVSQKRARFNLLYLPKLNRSSKFFDCSKEYEICYKTHITAYATTYLNCGGQCYVSFYRKVQYLSIAVKEFENRLSFGRLQHNRLTVSIFIIC